MKKKLLFAVFTLCVAVIFAQTEADFGVTLNDAGDGVVITKYTGKTLAVRIPATIQGMPVKEIGDRAFYGFNSTKDLTSVIIPAGVTKIGNEAFVLQQKLTSVTIPDSVAVIGNRAFDGCPFTSIVLPKSLTVIEENTFRSCRSLASVTLPEGMTEIKKEAFIWCEKLTSIKFPNSVTEIGEWAFGNCTSLTSVTFGTGIKRIGDSAFYYCPKLTTVTIPETVEKIEFGTVYDNGHVTSGDNVFNGCTMLTLASQAAIKRVRVAIVRERQDDYYGYDDER
jgi:hypothetical protein